MPLINIYATDSYFTCSRSPRGERGLKPCRYAYMRDGRNRHDNGRALLYDGMALPIDNQLIYYHYEESNNHSRD